jgi:uncharacterized tellurite resistance protein B-like protein
MDFKDYYTALGKLVYAIALADGEVQSEESGKIFDFVISQLSKAEYAPENGKTALDVFDIEKEFHRLREEKVPAQVACQQFINFVEVHKTDLTKNNIASCISLMEQVAESHQGINKAERTMISKIKNHLESL